MWDWKADLEANSHRHGRRGAVIAFLFDPSFTFMVWVRLFLHLKTRPGKISRLLANLVFVHIHKTFACYISYGFVSMGAGVRFPHPIGCALGYGVSIGNRVTIYQNVTLGRRLPDEIPQIFIGDNAILSAGAVVVGSVSIGCGSSVGANAVVLENVPDHSVAVGVPARLVGRKTT